VLRLRTLGGLSIEQSDGGATSTAATSARPCSSVGDEPRVRGAYERFLTQWPTADSDLVSIRKARDGLARLRSFQLQRESKR
jgi:hypothetical protein